MEREPIIPKPVIAPANLQILSPCQLPKNPRVFPDKNVRIMIFVRTAKEANFTCLHLVPPTVEGTINAVSSVNNI